MPDAGFLATQVALGMSGAVDNGFYGGPGGKPPEKPPKKDPPNWRLIVLVLVLLVLLFGVLILAA